MAAPGAADMAAEAGEAGEAAEAGEAGVADSAAMAPLAAGAGVDTDPQAARATAATESSGRTTGRWREGFMA